MSRIARQSLNGKASAFAVARAPIAADGLISLISVVLLGLLGRAAWMFAT